jgi:hypothetical protein
MDPEGRPNADRAQQNDDDGVAQPRRVPPLVARATCSFSPGLATAELAGVRRFATTAGAKCAPRGGRIRYSRQMKRARSAGAAPLRSLEPGELARIRGGGPEATGDAAVSRLKQHVDNPGQVLLALGQIPIGG